MSTGDDADDEVATKDAEYRELPGRAYLRVQEANRKADQEKRRADIAVTEWAKVNSELEAEKRKRSPERALWFLGLIPVAFVALRILMASKGDPNTLRALVQNLNVTAVFLATILPFITPTFAFLATASILSGFSKFSQSKGKIDPTTEKPPKEVDEGAKAIAAGLVLGGACIVVSFSTVPMKYFIATTIICIATVAIYIPAERRHKFATVLKGIGAILIIAMIIGGFAFTLVAGMWLPREQLTVGWWKTGNAYVLSSDEVWTKYLDESTNKVHVLSSSTVRHREIISDADRWPNWTLWRAISGP